MAEGELVVGIVSLTIAVTAATSHIVTANKPKLRKLSRKCINRRTEVIEEFDGKNVKNKHYEAAEIYIDNKLFPDASMPRKGKVKDVYNDHKFKWVWSFNDPKNQGTNYSRSFELVYSKNIEEHKSGYLDYVIQEANKLGNKGRL